MTINEIKKEHTAREWLAMTMNSWTWARLTEEEKDLFMDDILIAYSGIIKGTTTQRWRILNALYSTFLCGLGYRGGEWRSTEKECPLF